MGGKLKIVHVRVDDGQISDAVEMSGDPEFDTVDQVREWAKRYHYPKFEGRTTHYDYVIAPVE